jgi:insecticidal toxin complex protein TccC
MSSNTHRHTPTLNVVDSRGVQVSEVRYLCNESIKEPEARTTRYRYDIGNQTVERYSHADDLQLKVADSTHITSLSGAQVFTDSLDAGWRLTVFGEAGQTLETWDSRGSHWQTEYDSQLRPRVIFEAFEQQARRAIERFTYAATSDEAAGMNQCGRLIRHDDPAGTLLFTAYDLTGKPLSQTRHVLKDLQAAHWPEELDKREDLVESGTGHTTTWRYAPTGETLEQQDAKGHTQRFWFDVAGQLQKITLQLNGATEQKLIVDQVSYNAQGQIESQVLGGNITQAAVFAPENGRMSQRTLSRTTTNPGVLQKLHYAYDAVGNVLSVEDHSKPEQYNANQCIKPGGTYAYDSLYQLIKATGRETQTASIHAALPEWLSSPADQTRLLNFTQRYTYDQRGNLTRLQHQREGNNYTREMRIAPDSNRGLSWKTGDSPPDFATGFDANGNLQALQNGQPLLWNARNQLQSVTLVERAGQAADTESYLYDGSGQRVRKRQTQKAHAVTQARDVLYLPSLEIRESTTEKLEVISVQAGNCNVRCLHWSLGTPSGISNDAMRFSFDNHFGSNTMELDANGSLISEEGYYPFGGTAWRAARNVQEAKYRTVRYSGKERDASGLYYYGQRYYAPWLQRWISPDPAGAVDGLNLYCMVANNPVRYIDHHGNQKDEAAIKEELGAYPGILKEVNNRVGTLNHQLYNSMRKRDIVKRMFQSYAYTAMRFMLSWGAGLLAAPTGPVGMLGTKIATSSTTDTIASKFNATRHLPVATYPQTSRLKPDEIEYSGRTAFYNLKAKAEHAKKEDLNLRNKTGQKNLSVMATGFILSTVLEVQGPWVRSFESSTQATNALEGLPGQKIERLNNALAELDNHLEHDTHAINAAFDDLGVEEFYAAGVKGRLGQTTDRMADHMGVESSNLISRASMQRDVNSTRATIQRGRELLFKLNEHNKSQGRFFV